MLLSVHSKLEGEAVMSRRTLLQARSSLAEVSAMKAPTLLNPGASICDVQRYLDPPNILDSGPPIAHRPRLCVTARLSFRNLMGELLSDITSLRSTCRCTASRGGLLVDANGLRRLVTMSAESEIVSRIGEGFDLTPVRIQLTGRVTVASAHAVVDERLLYGSQARLLFVLLVVERDRPVPRDELAEALWPHGLPRTWGAALRGVVSKVRTFVTAAGLPENAAVYDGFGAYQLRLPADVMVDVEFARSAVETAEQMLREGNPTRAIALAEYARSVAVCPFLPDAKGRWVDGVRDRLREVLLWALCVLGEGHAQCGRHQLAVQAAEQAIVLEPFRERTHQLLMRAHAAAGNPAEALRVFDRCRRLLAKELGAYPAAETAALHLALLRNES